VKKRIEFPLFELMLIIILLSVLIMFAFPKYESIGREARIRALKATVLNLEVVNRLLYSRAMIKGVHQNALQTTLVLGESDPNAYLVYGELRATGADLKRFLESDLIVYGQVDTENNIRLYLDRFKNNACYVNYQQADQKKSASGQVFIQKATYQVIANGC